MLMDQTILYREVVIPSKPSIAPPSGYAGERATHKSTPKAVASESHSPVGAAGAVIKPPAPTAKANVPSSAEGAAQ